MASLAARYAAGEHEQVWREINAQDLPLVERYALRSAPSPAEVEDVMRQTFECVARNVDRLIERLPEYGYRFECASGNAGNRVPPRQPGQLACRRAKKAVEAACAPYLEVDEAWPQALTVFADVVGSVDLRQESSEEPLGSDASMEEQQKARQVLMDPAFLSRVPKATQQFLRETVERNDAFLARERARAKGHEPVPHPFADDPVLAGLGEWDPLEVSFDFLAADLSEDEPRMSPLKDGGMALVAEFAGSFEHKANVSGAENPWFAFPANRVDPMVRAEGIHLPFSTYLRRVFARGGFFGVPRPITRDKDTALIEVEPGIVLPDHRVFTDLARDLELL